MINTLIEAKQAMKECKTIGAGIALIAEIRVSNLTANEKVHTIQHIEMKLGWG